MKYLGQIVDPEDLVNKKYVDDTMSSALPVVSSADNGEILTVRNGSWSIWDFEWDYTMGMPADNGLTRTVTGTVTETMTSDGLKIETGTDNSYIRYDLSTLTNTVGVMECEFICNINQSSTSGQNFGMCVSNGTNGGGTHITANNIRTMNSNSLGSNTVISACTNGTLYKERVVLKDTTFDVYVDDVLKLQDYLASNILYCVANRIFVQNTGSGYYVILKSIKAKFNRT